MGTKQLNLVGRKNLVDYSVMTYLLKSCSDVQGQKNNKNGARVPFLFSQ